MADLSEKIRLELNADELLQQLEGIEIEAEAIEEKVEVVKEKAKISFNETLGLVHAGWLATQGLVRAMGGSISTVFRTVVGTALGAISTLKPLLEAALGAGLASMNPYAIAQATIGILSLGTSIAALVSFQMEEKEISDALRGANMAMHGVSAMLPFFPTQ